MAFALVPPALWRRPPTQPTPLHGPWSRITGVWYPAGPAILGQGNDRDAASVLSGGPLGRAVRSADNGFFNAHGPTWTGNQPTVTAVGGWSVLCVYQHISAGWGQGGLVRTSARHGLGITGGVPTIYYDNTPRHTSAIAAPTTRPSVIIARMSQGGTDEIYVDGALGISAANGGYNYIGTLTKMGSGFGFGHTVGDFYLALSMPWYLSLDEIAALSENPFRVFRPSPARTYILGAGGGGGDLSVTVTEGTLTLIGQSVPMATAVAVESATATLTGQSAVLAQGLAVSHGEIALAGQSVALPIVLGVDEATITITGQTIGVPISMGVTAAALALAGQDVTLTNTADTGITVAVDAGTLTLTGQAIGLALSLAVTRGTLALAGQDVTIAVGGALTVPVTAGTLTLTGQPIGVTISATARPERVTWSLKRRSVGFALARRTVTCSLTRRTLTLAAS